VVHLDNCSVHTSRASADWLEEYGIRRMPHPPNSPDLAPIYFYLFSTMKDKLERIQLADEDQFFERLSEILRSIDQQELNGAFQAWVP
jgi:transposase